MEWFDGTFVCDDSIHLIIEESVWCSDKEGSVPPGFFYLLGNGVYFAISSFGHVFDFNQGHIVRVFVYYRIVWCFANNFYHCSSIFALRSFFYWLVYVFVAKFYYGVAFSVVFHFFKDKRYTVLEFAYEKVV